MVSLTILPSLRWSYAHDAFSSALLKDVWPGAHVLYCSVCVLSAQLLFMMSGTTIPAMRRSLSALKTWLVRSAMESVCKVTEWSSHVKRVVVRDGYCSAVS